ncbi:MAG TPA: hypothetical protein VGB18_07065 [Candidatus Thermoplasmatota archaeon]
MSRTATVPVDENGDIVLWKALAGAKDSHRMSRPVFPNHQPNYNLDRGVLIRVKAARHVTGEVPLEDEFAKRR